MPKRATFLFLAIAFVSILGGCKSSVGITNPPQGNSGPPPGYFWVHQDSILWKQENNLAIPTAFAEAPKPTEYGTILSGYLNANGTYLQLDLDSFVVGHSTPSGSPFYHSYYYLNNGFTYTSVSGSITVTGLDDVRDLISGTFNIAMVNSTSDTIHISGLFNSVPYDLETGTMYYSGIGNLEADAYRSSKNDLFTISGQQQSFTGYLYETTIKLSLHHFALGSRLITPDSATYNQTEADLHGHVINETGYSNSLTDSVTILSIDTLHRKMSGRFTIAGIQGQFDNVRWGPYY